jgi:hypothetical protein
MARLNLCLFMLLLPLLTSCQKICVDRPPRPQHLAMVALHDLTPTAAAVADCQCKHIEFYVQTEVSRKDLEDELGLDEDSASALLKSIEQVRALNALVCAFDSPPDDKQIRSIVRRSLGHKRAGGFMVLCSPAPDGGQDCTVCVERRDGKVVCRDFHIPPPDTGRPTPSAQ